ncbi:MAG: FadR/GntR family transcriptional regulator [Candidatus Bathyarchaeia archaeon]
MAKTNGLKGFFSTDLDNHPLIIYNFTLMIDGMVFREVASKKKSVQVAEQILEAIHQGIYKVGDRLPPERVIEEKTGVSKSSVREALSALQLAGIIKRIPGNGTYVCTSAEEVGVIALLEESESVEDVLEARRVIEKGVVELAIDKASTKQIQELEKIWKEMHALLEEKDYEKFFVLNERFHLALAEITNNPLILKVIHLLLRVTHQKLWKQIIMEYFLKNESYFQQSIEEHYQIFKAINNRDKDLANKVIERHFTSVNQILQLEEEGRDKLKDVH